MRLLAHFSVCAAFIGLVAMLVGAQETTKVYVNDEIGFQIEYPSSWEQAKVKGGNIVVLFTGGAINRNVQVMQEEGGEQEGRARLNKLAKILPNHRELSGEWRDVNGRRAYFQTAEWTSLFGANKAIRLMVPAGDHFFLVMAVSPAGEFEKLRPTLEKCVLSFKIKAE